MEGQVLNHLKQLVVEVDLTWLCVLQRGLGHGETGMVLFYFLAVGGQEVHHRDHGQVAKKPFGT